MSPQYSEAALQNLGIPVRHGTPHPIDLAFERLLAPLAPVDLVPLMSQLPGNDAPIERPAAIAAGYEVAGRFEPEVT